MKRTCDKKNPLPCILPHAHAGMHLDKNGDTWENEDGILPELLMMSVDDDD